MFLAGQSNRPQGCLSPKEFARRAGISLATVHRYLSSGQLTKIQRAGKNGRVWIPESELYSPKTPNPDDASSGSDQAEVTAGSDHRKSLSGKRPAWMNDLHSPPIGGNHAEQKPT